MTNVHAVLCVGIGSAGGWIVSQTDSQRQTDDFVENAKDEMRQKGFKTTPWDDYERKTPKTPPPAI